MSHIYAIQPNTEYELLDSGEGEKLERYGEVVLSRPDPQALWEKNLSPEKWKQVHAVYEHTESRGKWKILKHIPDVWTVHLSGVVTTLKLSPFKHVGVFPEQSVQWEWVSREIHKHTKNTPLSVLNLFGYTGGASVACSLAGADVTHVDASESSVMWAKANRDASGLSSQSIRFIVDDARKFVEREIRRGKKYDIVIMDPPTYGRGSKNELWKIENDLIPFLKKIKKNLSPEPVAFILNGYASGYSHTSYKQVLDGVVGDMGGVVESGELAISEQSGGRMLPCGIFARWSR